MNTASPARPRWTQFDRYLLLGGLLLVLYMATVSGVGSVDAYYYFGNVRGGDFRELCHPHHLAYLPLAYGWYGLWQALGYGGSPFIPMKLMSLFGAAGVLAGFARLVRLLFRDGAFAYALFLVLGLSYLPWHYATEGEPVIFFHCFSIWILYALLLVQLAPRVTAEDAWRLGLFVGLGTLFHQSLVFAVPMGLVVIATRTTGGERWRRLGLFAVTAGTVVGVPYVVLGTAVVGHFSPRDLVAWSCGYLDEFADAYGTSHNLLPRVVVTGLLSTYLGGSALKSYIYGGKPADAVYYLALVPPAIVAATLGLGLSALAWRWRRLEAERRTLLGLVALFTVVFLAAAVYWEPGSRKFWASILPGLVLLTGAGLCGIRRQETRFPACAPWSTAIVALLAATLLVGNLTGGILHKHRTRDTEQPLTLALLEVFRPGDLLVMPGNRLWQSIDFHFPEMTSAPVMDYVNPAWAARDTTLAFAARSLWATLQRGGTGYVASSVDRKVRLALTRGMPGFAAGQATHLTTDVLLHYADFEQDLTECEMEVWRWRKDGVADEGDPTTAPPGR